MSGRSVPEFLQRDMAGLSEALREKIGALTAERCRCHRHANKAGLYRFAFALEKTLSLDTMKITTGTCEALIEAISTMSFD